MIITIIEIAALIFSLILLLRGPSIKNRNSYNEVNSKAYSNYGINEEGGLEELWKDNTFKIWLFLFYYLQLSFDTVLAMLTDPMILLYS